MDQSGKMQATVTNGEPQDPPWTSPVQGWAPGTCPALQKTVFGCPRDFLNNRYAYVAISARARGLSIGVNMNPDKLCNFDCAYCEVDRRTPFLSPPLDVSVMSAELERTLAFVCSGQIRSQTGYAGLPDELLKLRHVALSGDGEPTLCPNFADAVQSVVHIRACGAFPFFKIALLTNATGLDLPDVQHSLKLLTDSDEIWAKLDAGSEAFMEKINRPRVSLNKVLTNILMMGRQRSIVIQSMFALLNGQEPPAGEIEQYVERLKELKAAGAKISLVQVYSPARPVIGAECRHLPLKTLSRIAKLIRAGAGLTAEVF
jgi:wyosine [tRNA(Phe)-imidazoG37] synthetase (radical SAM superfamily)